MESRGPTDLNKLNPTSHQDAAMIDCVSTHGFPISLTRGTTDQERMAEAFLWHVRLRSQIGGLRPHRSSGIFPIRKHHHYPKSITYIPNLWLYPVAVIPQEVRWPKLNFDFTWSVLNTDTRCQSPMESMSFDRTLQIILLSFLASDTRLEPVYLNKVNLTNIYNRFDMESNHFCW